MADNYYITINSEKICVSEEVYNVYRQMRRHERTLAEKDSRNFVLKYEDFADGEITGGLRDESGNLYDYIAGNFMIVGLGDEDFTSLPPEYIEKYSQLFAQPEILNITNGRFEVLPDASFEQRESEEPNMSM